MASRSAAVRGKRGEETASGSTGTTVVVISEFGLARADGRARRSCPGRLLRAHTLQDFLAAKVEPPSKLAFYTPRAERIITARQPTATARSEAPSAIAREGVNATCTGQPARAHGKPQPAPRSPSPRTLSPRAAPHTRSPRHTSSPQTVTAIAQAQTTPGPHTHTP